MGIAPWLNRRRTTVAVGLFLVLVFSWLGGLAAFTRAIPTSIADSTSKTDAIVVLTGGSERLDAGLALLADGKAQKLFVSGVHPGVEVRELLRVTHSAPTHLECCIVLGHEADSTLGNAIETARWMAMEQYKSLRLVTGAYHMPRSLLEFRRAMPETRIVPNPVFPERVKLDWWRWPGSAALVVGEYHKYLGSLLRALLSPQEPARA